jgi:hypothetical protein
VLPENHAKKLARLRRAVPNSQAGHDEDQQKSARVFPRCCLRGGRDTRESCLSSCINIATRLNFLDTEICIGLAYVCLIRGVHQHYYR